MIIDFVEPPRPSRNAWIALGVAGMLVLVLAAWNVHLQTRVDRARAARLAPESLAKAPLALPVRPPVPFYQQEALVILKRAALPEGDALAELENVAVIGINLKSIDVNPAASSVVVELEAVNDMVLGDYLDQLNAGMPAAKWHIQRVSALGEGRAVGAAPGVGDAVSRSATIARNLAN